MSGADTPADSTTWYRRLHAALMPDYNRAATVYWWLAACGGGALLLACLLKVSTLPALALLQIMAGLAFAVGAGLFPVRIPGTKVSFGVGEWSIYLVLLLQGTAAAAVLAAAEAGIGSYRTSKRWTSRLGSPAMATLAMVAAGSLFQAGRDALEARAIAAAPWLLALSLAFGLVYFFFSATLMGATARLRRGQHLLQPGDVVGVFRWVGLAYAGSAMFATLLYIVYRQAGAAVFGVTAPLVLMLLLVLHFFYRQQEAQEALRAALTDVARREQAMQEREAEVAARHGRELQMSERRFHGAFTRAAIGMALVDLDGRVVECNEALARLLSRPAQDMLGLGLAGLLHLQDRDRLVARLAQAHDVHFEDFVEELRLLDAGGREHRVRLHCSFFGGPSRHGAVQPGKPCLMLQVQALEPAGRSVA
jgi:PAS domain S-box-containing protein